MLPLHFLCSHQRERNLHCKCNIQSNIRPLGADCPLPTSCTRQHIGRTAWGLLHNTSSHTNNATLHTCNKNLVSLHLYIPDMPKHVPWAKIGLWWLLIWPTMYILQEGGKKHAIKAYVHFRFLLTFFKFHWNVKHWIWLKNTFTMKKKIVLGND